MGRGRRRRKKRKRGKRDKQEVSFFGFVFVAYVVLASSFWRVSRSNNFANP
jgi:hypothetical protein